MATLEVARKAFGAHALPALLVVNNPHKTASLPKSVEENFQDAETLPNSKAAIELKLESGETLAGNNILEYYAKASGDHVAEVQEWIKRSADLLDMDFKVLRKPFEELNSHLILRSHIVGHRLTVADLVIWGTIRGNRVASAALKKTPDNVARWYSYIEVSNPWIAEVVTAFNAQATKDRLATSRAGASYDIDLPEVKGAMVTRFPPEPSGYLHIGHAKAALLNDYFAHHRPGGTLICRFDDTNPTKESMEFQDAIIHDLHLVNIKPDKVSYSSDYFQQMYELAIQLIKDGKAFADDSELGKGDEDRKNRLPSKRRDLGIEETLKWFAEMKTGSTEGQRWCIRARIQYDSPNGTMRDPVIYRCNLTPHHRTGSTWKIYPTYDFCAPILDSLEGVTVALRTNEYRDRNVQYEWMQENLGLRKVGIWDFSRMNFIRTVLSKRKLTRIVNEGKVWGWDDPRMPTIRGILRRGMTVEPFREFVLMQGPSRNILNLEWGQFWAFNKRHIDPIAPRHTAIAEQDAVRCTVSGVAGPETVVKPKHIKNLAIGTKNVMYSSEILVEQADAQTFQQDEEITLMNWGNAFVRKISKEGSRVAGLDLELHLAGDFKKTKLKVTWLAATTSNMVPVDLVAFDYLITKDKLEKDDELEKCLTPVTEFRTQAVADCNVAELKAGDIIQFERKGYYRLDQALGKDGAGRMVFFDIPTGRA